LRGLLAALVGSVGSGALGGKQRVQVVRGLTAGARESVCLQKTGGLAGQRLPWGRVGRAGGRTRRDGRVTACGWIIEVEIECWVLGLGGAVLHGGGVEVDPLVVVDGRAGGNEDTSGNRDLH